MPQLRLAARITIAVIAVLSTPNTVTVQAIDAAGNRSTSRGAPVTGYYTPGCTPYTF
jgi:hypothetical protein